MKEGSDRVKYVILTLIVWFDLTRGHKIFGKIAEVKLFSLHSFSHFSEDQNHVSEGSDLLQGEEWKVSSANLLLQVNGGQLAVNFNCTRSAI